MDAGSPRFPRARLGVLAAVVLVLVVVAAACGSDGSDTELAGLQQDPAPQVGQVALPDALDGGTPAPMRAEPGELLLVFFGFTRCPDICPTTMATVATALDQHPDLVDEVELAMVSVDPDRDSAEVMAPYVSSFVDRARALRTDDPDALRAAADAFGASYLISTDADGEPDVGHSAYLYGVDDRGEVVVTWGFGVTPDELSSDLSTLLTES